MAVDVQDLLDRVDKLEPLIREQASAGEARGNVLPEVIDAIRDAELFRALIPEDHGGRGVTLPDYLRITERIASFDASTGWTFTILGSGALFARYLDPDAVEQLWGPPPMLMVGSLNPAATRAERVDGGYVFSGVAGYLSGSAHADWIMAGAIVTENGEPVVTEMGIEIRIGAFPIDQARSLDTWNVTGMRATGSTDYAFENVSVASGFTFEPFRPRPPSDDVFSAIPLWAQLGGTLAACAVGTARNMVERFIELAATKVPAGTFARLAERAPAQIALGEAEGLAQAAHAVLYETAEWVWARGVAGEPFDNETLGRQRLGIVTAVRLAAQSIDLLHDAAGMNAVAQDSVLDRCWRDVHTMTQHVVLASARYEIAGRALLGIDPGSPFI